MLSESQIQRYSRQILLREVGGRGQERLLGACVRLPALDSGGRACAMWLARAGVGALELPEDRSPAPAADEAGLLHASDAGRPLVEAVRDRLRFHGPSLAFDRRAQLDAHASAGPIEGALVAVGVVRELLVAGAL